MFNTLPVRWFASASAILLVVMAMSPGRAQESAPLEQVFQLFGAIFDPTTGPTFDFGGEVSGDVGIMHGNDAIAYNNAGLRRAKLGVEGRIVNRLGYRIIGDLSGDQLGLAEGYIAYRYDFETGRSINLQAGHFKPPNTLEFLSSGRFVSLMERSASSQAFGFARQFGVGVDYTAGNIGLSAGVFSYSADAERQEGGGRNISVRGYRTVRIDNTLRHVGVSLRFRDAGTEDPFQYSAQLPIRLSSDEFINTGKVGNDDRFAGGEFLYATGPYHGLVELGVIRVGLSEDVGDAVFWGASAEAGYWITGEITSDSFEGGRWQRPDFKAAMVGNGGWGAAQLIAGLDWADFSDGTIRGGRQISLKAGANWWLRSNVRVSSNIAYSLVRDSTSSLAAGSDGRDNIFMLGARAQFDF